MAGLSRFDFYPRDWISGTRTLSVKARGAYIDLLAAMYDRGGALEYDETWLRKFLGLRDVRQLRPLIRELTDEGKIEIINGEITNGRAMSEIEAAEKRVELARAGGRAKAKNASKSPPERVQQASNPRTDGAGFVENQEDKVCSPSPSPSKKNSNYVFAGKVIRVDAGLFADWEKSFSNIPNLKAQLQSRDTWLETQPERDRKKWIHSTAAWLANKDAGFAKAAVADDPYADPFIGVETDSW